MYFLRLEKQAALELAAIPALVAFAWNPRRFFWKTHFTMRADAAFEQALKLAR
ncbi:hypothetical protein B0G82_7938 [Paraburkholderia sp. BL17N1]|nr:hypothetical protein B0G82_7938 [Paraburkholderia sp. BL17N1]